MRALVERRSEGPADLFGFVHGPSSRDFRVERKWRSSSRENDECVQATERR